MSEVWKNISSNASAGRGPLTEREFFEAMEAAMRFKPQVGGFLTSSRTIAAGRAAAQRLEERADELEVELAGLARWRWLKRRRLQRRRVAATAAAHALRQMFGS